MTRLKDHALVAVTVLNEGPGTVVKALCLCICDKHHWKSIVANSELEMQTRNTGWTLDCRQCTNSPRQKTL